MSQALVLALSGALFKPYPRHRWLGADYTTNQVGICEAVHGLLSAAFERMLAKTMTAPVPQSTVAVTQSGLPAAAVMPEASAMEIELSTMVSAGLDNADHPMLDAAFHDSGTAQAGGPSEEGPTAPWTAQAAINALRKRRAQEWLGCRPLSHLIGIRLCMSPLTRLLEAYLQRSSQEWGNLQRALVAKECRKGCSPRQRSLEEYLELTAEKTFFDDLRQLCTGEHWSQTDEADWTQELEALFFRMIARMGALVHEQLVLPTRRHPLEMLKQLNRGPVEGGQVAHTKMCLLDDWSSKMLDSFPGKKLWSEEAQALVNLLLTSTATETVAIEWGHGRVSRMLGNQGGQTHSPSMDFLNA